MGCGDAGDLKRRKKIVHGDVQKVYDNTTTPQWSIVNVLEGPASRLDGAQHTGTLTLLCFAPMQGGPPLPLLRQNV